MKEAQEARLWRFYVLKQGWLSDTWGSLIEKITARLGRLCPAFGLLRTEHSRTGSVLGQAAVERIATNALWGRMKALENSQACISDLPVWNFLSIMNRGLFRDGPSPADTRRAGNLLSKET